jgi:hypothetical protein
MFANVDIEDNCKTISAKLKSNEYKFGPKNKGRSSVWELFRAVNKNQNGTWKPIEGFVGCIQCCHVSKYLSKKLNTSNLCTHKCVLKLKKPSSDSTGVSYPSIDNTTRKHLSDTLTAYSNEDHVPLIAVAGAGFQKWMNLMLQIGHTYGTNIDINHLFFFAQINWKIHKHFHFDFESNKSKCLINNCNQTLDGRVLADMKCHLTSVHSNLAVTFKKSELYSIESMDHEILDISSNSKTHQNEPTKMIQLNFNENILIKGCIKMVIDNNLSCNFLNSEGLQMIVDPIATALGTTLNSASVLENISSTASSITEKIRLELNLRIFNLKLDVVTKNGKSFVGLTAQFLDGGAVKVRGLCLLKFDQPHTWDHLKNLIVSVVNKNGLSLTQVHTIIIDNAKHFIEQVNKIKNDNDSPDENLVEHCETDDYIDDIIVKLLELNPINSINCEKCLASIFQLVISDIMLLFQEEINDVRIIVIQLNLPKYEHYFVDQPTMKPVKDVVTRPITTYLMIRNISDNIWFYKNLLSHTEMELNVCTNIFKFIERFTPAFEPVYIAFQKFQQEQIIIGKS